MTTAAFLLVLSSAVLHSTWNLLLKQSNHKTAFLWAFSAVSFAAFLVPAIVFFAVDGLTWKAVLFGLVSASLHGGYGLLLSRGYEIGDLSAVYPVSRGMGPALIPLFAFLLLDESISWVAGVGIAFVVLGVYTVQARSLVASDLLQPLRGLYRPATRVALLTGVFIASYSLWDKAALDHLAPVALHQFSLCGYLVLLAPGVLRSGAAGVRGEWKERRAGVVAAGVLAPLAYVLVLIALTDGRVGYIAPAREIGIVLGALMGITLLGEGFGPPRIAGSVLIVAGVITLGLAP